MSVILFFVFGTYTRRTTVNGVIMPDSGLVKVYAQQSGILNKREVVEGQRVTRGQALYTLSTDLQSSVGGLTQAALIAQTLQSKASLEQEMNKTKLLQRDEHNTLRTKIDSLRATLGRIDEQLAAQRIRTSIAADGTITPGESVAIVGPSGCGKTTLVNVLLGALEPTSGVIRIGGIELGRLGLERLRTLIGAVMQDDVLFAGSIAQNISFFDPDADSQWIAECARLAAVHDDIAAMPMGYNTLVGDMGTVLSGGQKQRVLLAQALYRRPKILVLDEATSHLDLQREQHVNAAVSKLKMTRIIVAHRPETIASASRVVMLDGGKVVFDRQSAIEHRAHPAAESLPR
nr:ATP-binding cassette domain-containing protein [Paraburkholderia sp.]